MISAVSYLADFVGLGMLVHLLWPRSTNRRYFLDEEEMERLAGTTDGLEEFELPETEQHPEDPCDSINLLPKQHFSPHKIRAIPPHLDLLPRTPT